MDYVKILTEAGYDVYRPDFVFLSEATQLKVTDDALSGMMKFITDKYNSLDFSEIEKSGGDIEKFRYKGLILENNETLRNIYQASDDPGAKKYVEVCNAIAAVMGHLAHNRNEYMTLYRQGNGVVQLLYTSLVAGCIYATGTLVSNTIRFVTTEQNTECEVLYDEIPGTLKHVHIRNILSAYNDIDSFETLIQRMMKTPAARGGMNESITVSSAAIAVMVTAGVILLIPRIIMLIREIIYSIYYSRVKNYEMLEMQIDLLKTNIESLEQGRGSKKVIARQKKIVEKLQKWQNRIALKMDTTEVAKKTQQKKENAALRLDKDSPLIQDAAYSEANGLLI